MAKYTFKQFQAEYPNDAACLAKLMEINYGGTEITCPGCGVERAKFHPMTKRRAYRLPRVRPPHLPGRWHDLSQVADKADQVVFRDVSDDQHAPRRCGEGNRATIRRHVQMRLAHVPRIAQADGRGRSRLWWRPGLKGHVEIDETLVGGRRKGH